MTVYLVKEMVDYGYFSRDVVAVCASHDGAMEYIEAQGGQKMVMGWDDVERPMYTVEEWEVQ